MEDNKLIAEFMGIRYAENRNSHKSSDYYYEDIELEYHTSWDWLMPVAKKIVREVGLDIEYESIGRIWTFEYKVKQYSKKNTLKELSEIQDKLLKNKNKSKAQQENLMAITTAIGVKRNPDFYKDKMSKGGEVMDVIPFAKIEDVHEAVVEFIKNHNN